LRSTTHDHSRRNLEAKVHATEVRHREVRARLITLGARLTTLRQVDTYLVVPHGRLKLRESIPSDGPPSAELIAYHRPDALDTRWSTYHRVPIDASHAQALAAALTAALGCRGVVDKERTFATLGRTRVHLDRVSGLGEFIELETVTGDDDAASAAAELAAVASSLGITLTEADLIAGSYSNLLATADDTP